MPRITCGRTAATRTRIVIADIDFPYPPPVGVTLEVMVGGPRVIARLDREAAVAAAKDAMRRAELDVNAAWDRWRRAVDLGIEGARAHALLAREQAYRRAQAALNWRCIAVRRCREAGLGRGNPLRWRALVAGDDAMSLARIISRRVTGAK